MKLDISELLELAKQEVRWSIGECSKEYLDIISPDKMIALLKYVQWLEKRIEFYKGEMPEAFEEWKEAFEEWKKEQSK